MGGGADVVCVHGSWRATSGEGGALVGLSSASRLLCPAIDSLRSSCLCLPGLRIIHP